MREMNDNNSAIAFIFECDDESLSGPVYSAIALYYKVLLLTEDEDEADGARRWAEEYADPFFHTSFSGEGYSVTVMISKRSSGEARELDSKWEEMARERELL